MPSHKDIVTTNLHVPGYMQSSDPGAVGAGKQWIDTTAGAGLWVLKIRNVANSGWETVGSGGGGGAPTGADYLVGTAHAGLSAEIVAGTTPGGELGGTWGSPTVDATHSGSTHAAAQAAAEATAAGALSGHAAAGDPHTGYRLESADHSHASSGAQAGQIAHSALTGNGTGDDHTQYRLESADHNHSASGMQGGAITREAAPTRHVFTSTNASWSIPAGARAIDAECVGGGGGSGGTAATASGSRGVSGAGGGGGYVRKLWNASLPSTLNITVGGLGAAGAAGNNAGSAGGTSSVAGTGLTTIQATGGGGGAGSAAETTASTHAGGAGGVGSSGDVNGAGSAGDNGRVLAGPATLPIANGGSSVFGGGGGAGEGATGSAGTGYGGGGGSTSANASDGARAGAAGTQGLVVVTVYY